MLWLVQAQTTGCCIAVGRIVLKLLRRCFGKLQCQECLILSRVISEELYL